MTRRRTRSGSEVAIGLAAVVFGVGSAAAGEEGGDSGMDLSMEEIVSILSAQNLGEVYEVEREFGGYEVKIRDPEDRWLTLYVDSKTGEILHEEREEESDPEGDEESDPGGDEEFDQEPKED